MSERQLSEREIKALQIAAKTQLKRKGKVAGPVTSGPG